MQPERIGPYRIDGVLGSGGMGEVFLAYDERLRRPVAIKQLRADSQRTDERRARLRREAQAVALLNHPAIVQVHDIVTVDDIDHVVMEYVDGMPLASFLTDQSPQLSEILQLAQDIAEGLAEAHSKGVVHRDLKSENILVTHNGRAKILDFGLAKQLWSDDGEDSLSLEGALIGTSVAMSPEQAQGRRVDHRSDLFSFGILLYEMLTGHRPFLGATPLSTIHKIINEEPPPAREQAPELPQELFDLLDQLLEKKPRDRPQHALVVAEVLDRLRVWTMGLESGDSRSGSQAPIAVVGPVLAAAESDRQHLVRRRWMFAAVALVLLLAVLAIVFYLPHRANAREPLRVAVPEVVSTAADLPEAEAAAAVVRMTLLRGLTSLKGVTTFDLFEVDELVDAEIGLGEALAADEILRASLRKVGTDQIRVDLRRVSAVDGELIEADAFEAPLDDMRLLSRVGYSKVHALYRGFDARREGSPFNVRLDDYQRFLVLREMALGGQKLKPAEEILDELEQIRGTSPLFLEVYLLEGRMARYLFRRTRNPMYRDRAFKVLEQVRELAPEDPRPLVRLIETAISAQDLSRAESLLEELEKLEPGDVDLLTVRAQLEEAKGSVDGARELLQKAVQRKPALSYLMALADFELRVGQVGEAERHLEAVLERAPSNYMARSKLAQIELISGDPQRAAELYQQLVDLNPDAITVSNLGLAHLLLGRYREAAEAFRQARALDSEELSYVLNLADCYWLLGNKQEARRLYREVVAGVEKLEQTLAQPIDWPNRSLMSQALAHLGDDERAVRLTEEVLEQSAGDHRASFGAAIVYALVGLRTEARTHLERARSGGFSESWADLPWFTKLTASRAQNPSDVL